MNNPNLLKDIESSVNSLNLKVLHDNCVRKGAVTSVKHPVDTLGYTLKKAARF